MGFEIEVPSSYQRLTEEAEAHIDASLEGRPKARKMWDLLRADPEVNACWDMADYITTANLRYNDHGEVHAKVVAANALRMLDLLLDAGVLPDVMADGGGDEDDAHLIVLAGGLLHDIGNQVHRREHNVAGVYLAIPILSRLLPEVYGRTEFAYEVRARILHCIYAHEFEVEDLTLESGLVGVADGTDMTKGRGRLAYDSGNVNIHTVSALSIDRVEIGRGKQRPVRITVQMSNSAGIFQVQETVGEKIAHSPLRDHVELVAVSRPLGGDKDDRILQRLILTDRKWVAV
ncbi:MAG TPA: HD domain-containing protein [Candidatus Korarchaeota archaeon]|nr:HD domain-containing protein [Candidatus Korarchaeota archaeon]